MQTLPRRNWRRRRRRKGEELAEVEKNNSDKI
jgi:hypothetical protein